MPSPLRPSVLLVTGTDTGVGKTHTSRAILRALTRRHQAVAPLKLVETGCTLHDGVLLPADGLALARAARCEHLLDVVAPERFPLPAAPSTAARAAGTTLRFDALEEHVHRAGTLAPRVLLEGAGGLLVPIGPDGTFREFAARVRASVLIVARDALGTLNHTALTIEGARMTGLRVAGVVLNAVGPERCTLEHARELSERYPEVPVYGPLPWMPDTVEEDEALADALERAGLDVPRLLALWG
jgi:dethiobiotin synthetase